MTSAITGFYAPTKDFILWRRARKARGLAWTCRVQQMGERTWIEVTAQCKPRATQTVQVRACRAERFEKAFDSCVEAAPVAERTIRFRPTGPRTIKPGEPPARWDAQFVTEHLRRSAERGEETATAKEMGSEVVDVRRECKDRDAAQRASSRRMPRLFAALDGPPSVRIQVVLDLADEKPFTSEPMHVPPMEPLGKRLRAAWRGPQGDD